MLVHLKMGCAALRLVIGGSRPRGAPDLTDHHLGDLDTVNKVPNEYSRHMECSKVQAVAAIHT